MVKIPVLILFAFLLLPLPLCPQEQGIGDAEPEEYQKEESSPFLRDLRRAEIVMLGSFPLTLFVSLELFDIYRYVKFRGDPEWYRYTPWPFRSSEPVPYGSSEKVGIVLGAVSASLLIAVADYIIGRAREKQPER